MNTTGLLTDKELRRFAGHRHISTTQDNYIDNIEDSAETDNLVLRALENEIIAKSDQSDQKIIPFPGKKKAENLNKIKAFHS